MKYLIYTLIVNLFLISCHSLFRENTKKLFKTNSSSIKVKKGILKGKTAKYDSKSNLWIIQGEKKKSMPIEKYRLGNECPPGITFDSAKDYPKNFKKLYWLQNIYGNNSVNQSNFNNTKKKIESLADNKGFGVILFPDSYKTVLYDKKNKNIDCDLILFHPFMTKAAKELCEIIIKGKKSRRNEFEIGALLGYRIVDVYAWCFGTEEAKKTFPHKKFNNLIEEGYDNVSEWKKLGLKRLKDVLKDEFEFVVAGEPDIII